MTDTLLLPRRQVVVGAVLGGVAAAVPAFGQAGATSPELDALKALLTSYEKAFSAQDVAGVLKHFAPNAVIMGTGPGEIWGGPDEIKTAFTNFFAGFDPGKQTFEPLFRDGHILGDMAWVMSMAKVTLTKGANKTEFGLNQSVIFEKINGAWLVRGMHFSNLTPGAPPKATK